MIDRRNPAGLRAEGPAGSALAAAAPLALLGLGLLALAGCGGSPCKSACAKMARCLGVDLDAGIGYASASSSVSSDGGSAKAPAWTCQLSVDCSAKESCLAHCIDDASCEALTGKDPVGAAALAACQLECAKQRYDSGVKSSEGIRSDNGCVPSCSGRLCGDDGCGGTCGLCVWPETCSTAGQCECRPRCTGKHCGDDGCGGSCGSCGTGSVCNASGLCVSSCTPCCAGKECGSDGCGGSCGSCPSGSSCDSLGTCQTPVSSCGGVSYEGCCSGTTLKYCSSGQLVTQSCASSPSCGWDSTGAIYDCGTSGGSDPSGIYPRTCP